MPSCEPVAKPDPSRSAQRRVPVLFSPLVTGTAKSGRLVVIGTPIGNLEDLSTRALRMLQEADAILCEDTRVTAKLASRFGLSASRISCPAPREKSRVDELLRRLAAGETVALVSDAGMPALSDPGEHLVSAAATAGFRVLVVPGPSAPAAALSVCGLPAVPHLFLGFLPARAAERRRLFEQVRSRTETLVWFEAPHRLVPSLEEAAAVLGSQRRACVAREMTKLHEEAVRGTLAEIAAAFASRGTARGEATVVVEGAKTDANPAASLPDEQLDGEIERALASGSGKRSAARQIARRFGKPAREVYARAVALSGRKGRRTGET